MAAQIFAGCVVFVCAMLIWFRVVRPVLEDYGVIVNSSEDSAPVVMSRSEQESAGLSALSLQTDAQTDGRPSAPAPLSRDIMIDICRDLRSHGYNRESARMLLRKLGQPLDNNIWAAAAPPEPAYQTPIAGRPTAAQFETDPDYPYAPPA